MQNSRDTLWFSNVPVSQLRSMIVHTDQQIDMYFTTLSDLKNIPHRTGILALHAVLGRRGRAVTGPVKHNSICAVTRRLIALTRTQIPTRTHPSSTSSYGCTSGSPRALRRCCFNGLRLSDADTPTFAPELVPLPTVSFTFGNGCNGRVSTPLSGAAHADRFGL